MERQSLKRICRQLRKERHENIEAENGISECMIRTREAGVGGV